MFTILTPRPVFASMTSLIKGELYSHRCCTYSCNRGQNVVKRSSNFEGCGQLFKRQFHQVNGMHDGQDNVSKLLAHVHYAYLLASSFFLRFSHSSLVLIPDETFNPFCEI